MTLDQLNEVSQPWVELEYNRKVHSEIGQTPLQRFLNDKNVAQPCPATEKLQLAFTTEVRRLQRRSDGTLTLEGIRFEVPSRFGHLPELWLRYASWDLSTVYLADPKTGAILCRIYPVDKTKNAEGRRAPRASVAGSASAAAASGHGAFAPKDHPPIRHHRLASGLSASNPNSPKPLMNKRLLNLYSLKFNPFSSQVPGHRLVDATARSKASAGASNSRSAKAALPWSRAIRAWEKAPRCASCPST